MNKKEIIISNAKKLFVKFGFSKTSLNDIANSAKIGIGTIYYYFSSKEEIFISVFNQIGGELLESIEKIYASQGNSIDKLFAMYTSAMNILDENNTTIFAELDEFPKEAMGEALTFKNQLVSLTKKYSISIIEEGQENGTIRKDLNPTNLVLIFHHLFRYDTNITEFVNTCSHLKFLQENKEAMYEFFKNHLSNNDLRINNLERT